MQSQYDIHMHQAFEFLKDSKSIELRAMLQSYYNANDERWVYLEGGCLVLESQISQARAVLSTVQFFNQLNVRSLLTKLLTQEGKYLEAVVELLKTRDYLVIKQIFLEIMLDLNSSHLISEERKAQITTEISIYFIMNGQHKLIIDLITLLSDNLLNTETKLNIAVAYTRISELENDEFISFNSAMAILQDLDLNVDIYNFGALKYLRMIPNWQMHGDAMYEISRVYQGVAKKLSPVTYPELRLALFNKSLEALTKLTDNRAVKERAHIYEEIGCFREALESYQYLFDAQIGNLQYLAAKIQELQTKIIKSVAPAPQTSSVRYTSPSVTSCVSTMFAISTPPESASALSDVAVSGLLHQASCYELQYKFQEALELYQQVNASRFSLESENNIVRCLMALSQQDEQEQVAANTYPGLRS